MAGDLPLAKPTKRDRLRRRRQRESLETQVKRVVRKADVARDGKCRLARTPIAAAVPCGGPSEWAHCAGHRRSQTMRQAAERRHGTATSFMACRTHHQLHESNRLRELPLSEHGMDGAVRWRLLDHRQEHELAVHEEER